MRDILKYLYQRLCSHWRGADPIVEDERPNQRDIEELISKIRSSHLTYCGPPKLENLVEAALRVRQEEVQGVFVEAGVGLGGSAILLAKLKPLTGRLDLYDIFSMIPPPGMKDGEDAHRRYEEICTGQSAGLGGKIYYGYMENLLNVVKTNLTEFGLNVEGGDIQFISGLFEDTLHLKDPVALAHIDCDWYDSVRVCIERLSAYLSPGGIIVFDDYSSYSGCRRAVDEWLDREPLLEKIFYRRSLGIRRPAIV